MRREFLPVTMPPCLQLLSLQEKFRVAEVRKTSLLPRIVASAGRKQVALNSKFLSGYFIYVFFPCVLQPRGVIASSVMATGIPTKPNCLRAHCQTSFTQLYLFQYNAPRIAVISARNTSEAPRDGKTTLLRDESL